ncbi:hypothetical protein KXV29_004033 [Aspergillus fumigatus]|nr:hypothetical protein KXX14_000021 [Aspergillus fumigatus]KAH2338945.1 hypothetical protein KXV29_004033 [Aspergillus fumigatus]KAH3068319.1 hypothetical protein KXW16_002017 [Aspergillus fumigatus]OXN04004.1 hypothetical protein CDV58_07690 [Aspergillus fumigatus]
MPEESRPFIPHGSGSLAKKPDDESANFVIELSHPKSLLFLRIACVLEAIALILLTAAFVIALQKGHSESVSDLQCARQVSAYSAVDRCKRELLQVYDVLEIRLSGRYGGGTREYLAGQGQGKYSIADINAWAWVRNIRRIGLSENELAPLPHLQQWVDRIAARPAVERGLGEWYDEDVHPELLLETA